MWVYTNHFLLQTPANQQLSPTRVISTPVKAAGQGRSVDTIPVTGR